VDDEIIMIELLVNRTEKMYEKIMSMDTTLIRLTDGVVLHEQRSTALHNNQVNCKLNCDKQTEEIKIALNKITTNHKVWIATSSAIIVLIGAVASIVQIMDYLKFK
jgi:hypothetical protein